MRGTLVTAILLFIFAVVFWFAADAIPKSRLGGTVGADGLPKLLAVILGMLSAGLIAQSLLAMRATGPVVAAEPKPRAADQFIHLRAAGMLALGAAYLLIMPYLGYMLSVGLLLLAVAVYNGKRPSLSLIVFGILGAGFFYLLFVRLLDVPLPAGFWPQLIG
ncbi:tripartite tricarboxylate transporter TctB family protein [Microvirga roseola]|uniref:tripartite tricarboxylate transporter TctB family protein n=1 Tax=Microvirga roseola TaxID=2883126 RepID=UPI001E611994|nr:tripartite tricarboxylate transporter TctB family protein [Microvirga roseola]